MYTTCMIIRIIILTISTISIVSQPIKVVVIDLDFVVLVVVFVVWSKLVL